MNVVLGQKSVIGENNKVLNSIRSFINTEWYIILVAAIFGCLWLVNVIELSICFVCLLATFILVIQKDVKPVLPILMMCECIIAQSAFNQIAHIWLLALFLIPLFAGLIFHFVYYHDGQFVLGKMFFPYCAIFLALILGGLFSKSGYKALNLAMGAYIALLPLLTYVMCCNCVKYDENSDLLKYISKILIYLGIVCVLEVAIVLLKGSVIKGGQPYVGWGNPNVVGMLLILTFPFGFYLGVKEENLAKSIYYFALGCIECLAIVLLKSRGALLFGGLAMILAIIYAVIGSKGLKKKVVIGVLIAGIAIALLGGIVFFDKIKAIVLSIFDNGFKSSSRVNLYKEAWDCFKNNPIFGVGLNYIGKNSSVFKQGAFYLFHSTVFQIIGSLGIVGVVAYVYFYFVRIKEAFSSKDAFNFIAIIAFIGFEGYSLIDTGAFLGLPFGVIIAILSYAIEKNSNITSKSFRLYGKDSKIEVKCLEED